MPIYAYRCANCGHEKDVLQKLSDAPLTLCPACGKDAFSKQVTAAGFQLKGSGWYVTDFRGGNSSDKSDGASAPNPAAAAPKSDGAAGGASSGESAAAPASTSSEAAKPAAGASAPSGAA